MSITPAKLSFNEQGTPVADAFDDVYFSNANGMQETQYVFLHNNGLPERWLQWQLDEFTIAETGFGTGLNFLVTLQAWRAFRKQHDTPAHKRLQFISVEKFPLTSNDLQSTLDKWTELQDVARLLISQYPPAIEGCHRLHFPEDNVTLDLWFGDVQDAFPQVYTTPDGLVDAWFLDGFAPSKNPDMWQQSLFDDMARLARRNCTFATFTAAGIVKRGLQAAGFNVEKRKGFGHKRDMLAGHIEALPPFRKQAPYYQRSSINTKEKVVVIGGGLAASTITHKLTSRGIDVDVYTQFENLADGASGNRQGGFYPQLNAEASIASRTQALSFTYARRFYDSLLSSGETFTHDFCGVLQVAFSETVQSRYEKLINNGVWPQELVADCDRKSAAEYSGISLPYNGLWIADGGWISPPELVEATFRDAAKAAKVTRFNFGALKNIAGQKGDWTLEFADGQTVSASQVILALGSESVDLPTLADLPFRLVRGQVEVMPEQSVLSSLKCVLCHKGYLTPHWQGGSALGSTYVKNDRDREVRVTESEQNLQTQIKALSEVDWPEALEHDGRARASIRCGLPDHLPVVGTLPDFKAQERDYADLYKALPLDKYTYPIDQDGLYVFTGLGSRGLTTAPLLAEVLASQICGQALPLPNDLLNALNPNRFLIRNAIRAQGQPD